ncbi:small ribosomal subunit protein mS27 [Chanos chanos]|uniref:Small ribosomal subunit protein mS27 n=1 Tax=Chanos chanos TaxID=29144 RepID=A0A6J2VSG5_CHACN|nr:28S ribosomal protein S27, mitochondrial [Chanos chanos]
MATSILQRCLLSVKNASKCGTQTIIARRCLLSVSYTDAKVWEQREKDPQNLAKLASLMDRTYDRKFPVSSLTIARFVDNVSSREEVDQAEYYLYKFRHSPNCWFLRDWTMHGWIRQCLKYGAKDKALYTLKNKVQYGIFPDEFTFNLLIDSFLKDEDFKGACSVVEEVMLQESFDQQTTQILSLYALSKYLATKPELSWEEERNLGAALLLAGLKQDNSTGLSAQLLGYALIGKVEISRGIHSVFHQLPLIWTPGYVGRALAVVESVCGASGDSKLSKEVLDHVEAILQDLSFALEAKPVEEGEETSERTVPETWVDEDELERAKLPDYISKFKELRGQLQAGDKVDPSPFDTLTSRLAEEKLAGYEEQDVVQYHKKIQDWEAERHQLVQREIETRERAEQARLARQAAKAARQ